MSKFKIATLYDEFDAPYLGIVGEDDEVMDDDDVEIELSADEERSIRKAVDQRRSTLEAAADMRVRAEHLHASAVTGYNEKFEWLTERFKAATKAREDAEAAEEARQQREAEEAAAAKLAAEDAELGPREFLYAPMTADSLSKHDADIMKEQLWGSHHGRELADKYKVIHRQRCKAHQAALDNTQTHTEYSAWAQAHRAQALRLGPAISAYLMGAKACGVCKPDELMVLDEQEGEAVLAERRKRESVKKPVNKTQLWKDITAIGIGWATADANGFTEMSLSWFTDDQNEFVLGWKETTKAKSGSPIPEDIREQIFDHLTCLGRYSVRWATKEEGYLILGMLTAAQKRELREAKEKTAKS